MSDPPSSDSSNVSLASFDNDPSLTAAFEQCEGYLLAIAAKSLEPRLKTKVSTADLLQQTYLDAHRDIDRFRGDSTAQLRAWLRRILLNNIASTHRRFQSDKRNLNREQEGVETPTLRGREKTPSSIVANHEEMDLLEVAMQRLTAEERRVIRMRNLERKTFPDIGVELDRSDEQARKVWFRAMKSLRAALQEARHNKLKNVSGDSFE